MDDIDYLKANSQKHSYMFYVDSAKRNRQAYPSPNHYQVQFNTPLRNVYSIQVLDASVPRTHYNVDHHNNRLYYQTNDGREYFIDLDIGDYTHQQLLNALNEKWSPNGIEVSFCPLLQKLENNFCSNLEILCHMYIQVDSSGKHWGLTTEVTTPSLRRTTQTITISTTLRTRSTTTPPGWTSPRITFCGSASWQPTPERSTRSDSTFKRQNPKSVCVCLYTTKRYYRPSPRPQ